MDTPVTCLICLGSNIRPETNIPTAVKHLTALFPDIIWGTTVETPAEGITFYSCIPSYTNIAATFTTTLGPDEIKQQFRQIEDSCGRTPQSRKTGLVPLDIDLLIYGDAVLKPSDLRTAHVRLAILSLP